MIEHNAVSPPPRRTVQYRLAPKTNTKNYHKLSIEVENAYRYHVHGEDRVVNCPAPLVEIRVRVAKCGQRIRISRLICVCVIVPASTLTKMFRGCYVKYKHAINEFGEVGESWAFQQTYKSFLYLHGNATFAQRAV